MFLRKSAPLIIRIPDKNYMPADAKKMLILLISLRTIHRILKLIIAKEFGNSALTPT